MFETKFYTYWADADPAGIVFFPHFFRYVEQAEEELFRASGTNRQTLLEEHRVWMPARRGILEISSSNSCQ